MSNLFERKYLMELTTENILLVGSILLFISLIVGKTSAKFGVPVLILFLVIGMAAGSEGIGGIYFDNPATTQFIGILALSFILFSGGLDTDWKIIKPVLWQGITLSTLGVLITAVTLGIFIWSVTDFTIYEGLLLGSIVSSTDSAAVFSILRSKNLSLQRNLRSVLELESGSNDPMAYVLTIVFTGLVTKEDASLANSLPLFFKQLLLGTVLGFLFGILSKKMINSIKLDYEGLYIVLVIAIMFFSFAATDFVGGNGFLAVYLCAIYLGSQDLIHKKKYLKSFDSFAWLMQIVLFLTLGLLVFPSDVIPVIGIGLLISAFLIFISRPLSVFISLLFYHVTLSNKWFISWVGLRGAVPIVFATYPLLAGASKAHMIFNIVFFISLTSVLIQGTTLPFFSKWLKVSLPENDLPESSDLDEKNKTVLTEIVIPENSKAAGSEIVYLGIPANIFISMIKRENKYFIPDGATVIQPKDRLFILAEKREDLEKLQVCLGINHLK